MVGCGHAGFAPGLLKNPFLVQGIAGTPQLVRRREGEEECNKAKTTPEHSIVWLF